MRVVIDINVLVSALIVPAGPPAAVVRMWLEGKFTLPTCAELIQPHKAGRLVNQLRKLANDIDLPIPTTITCWLCPKRARLITS